MSKSIDLTGKRFGKLTILSKTDERSSNCSVLWKCKCDCGNLKFIATSSLKSGNIRSCGCIAKENMKKQQVYSINDCYIGTRLRNIQSNAISKNNTSGINGVAWDKSRNKWISSIKIKRKQIFLGRYKDINDAIKARQEAEEKYFKPIIEEYQNLNSESEDK